MFFRFAVTFRLVIPAAGTKTGGSLKYWVLVAPNQYMQSGRIAARLIGPTDRIESTITSIQTKLAYLAFIEP